MADPAKEIRSAALNLARAKTYTPIPYWMSMPLVDLIDFFEDIQEIEQKQKKASKK